MASTPELLIRMAGGAAAVLALLVGIRRVRSQQWWPRQTDRLLQEGLHFGLVGAIAGYTVLPAWREPLSGIVLLASYFLVAWFGFAVGLGLDQRSLHRSQGAHLALDLLQAGTVAAIVVLAAYAAWSLLAEDAVQVEVVLVLGGICAALAPRALRVRGNRSKAPPRRERFSLAACIGALIYGAGALPLRGKAFEVQIPFTPEGKTILVQSTLGEMVWCGLLGGTIGVILDLLTRDAQRRALPMLVGSGLALGAGAAVGLGLDPVWTGIVAGAWLINGTLRRLELMRSMDQAHTAMRLALCAAAGWVLGSGLAVYGVSARFLVGVLIAVCVVRSVGLWLGTRSARHLAAVGFIKIAGTRDVPATPNVGILGLALALSAVQLMEGRIGVALLGGVMGAQWILSLVGVRDQETATTIK